MNTALHFSSASPIRETPQSFFDALHSEFGFTLDVCARADNAKCARFYSEEQDGLAQTWEGVTWTPYMLVSFHR